MCGTLEFYSKYMEGNKFPAVRSHALFTASLNICEQLFSRMKIVNSKLRNKLSGTHLENSLHIASFNIDNLVKIKQCQVSH